MKVRECLEGTEFTYEEDDCCVIIKCPVCSDVWLRQDESVGSCQHIRFVYSTFTDSFLFYGDDWDHASFEKSFRVLAHFDDDDCYPDEEQGFRDLNHPDIDAVIYWDQQGWVRHMQHTGDTRLRKGALEPRHSEAYHNGEKKL